MITNKRIATKGRPMKLIKGVKNSNNIKSPTNNINQMN